MRSAEIKLFCKIKLIFFTLSSRGSAEKIKVATISELSYEEYERNSVHVTVSYADDVMKSYAGLSVGRVCLDILSTSVGSDAIKLPISSERLASAPIFIPEW